MTFPISLVSRPDLATLVASYTITERPLVSWMPGKCIPDISRCSGISDIEVGCLNSSSFLAPMILLSLSGIDSSSLSMCGIDSWDCDMILVCFSVRFGPSHSHLA
uniref:Uncharacterized protein n=1 Tax=Cacopsylla melanoneura TaxID=428564 RepID=A0A8D8UZ38_9HEMI